jgi:hypothetical protein
MTGLTGLTGRLPGPVVDLARRAGSAAGLLQP